MSCQIRTSHIITTGSSTKEKPKVIHLHATVLTLPVRMILKLSIPIFFFVFCVINFISIRVRINLGHHHANHLYKKMTICIWSSFLIRNFSYYFSENEPTLWIQTSPLLVSKFSCKYVTFYFNIK